MIMKAKIRKLPSGNQRSLIDGAWCSVSAAEAHACVALKSSKRLKLPASPGFYLPFPGPRFWLRQPRVAALAAFGCPLPAVHLPTCSLPFRELGPRVFRAVGAPLARSLLSPYSPRPVLGRFALRIARAAWRLHVPIPWNRVARQSFRAPVPPAGADKGERGPWKE